MSLQLHLWGSGEVIDGVYRLYCVGGGVFRE